MNQPSDTIESFLHIFIHSLQKSVSQADTSALIKELYNIKASDINLLQSTPQGKNLVRECIRTMRDKIYELLCAGHICGVEYLYILLFVSRTDSESSLKSTKQSTLETTTSNKAVYQATNEAQSHIFSPETIEIDSRFEVFVKLAQESLFMQRNSDVENMLFIELYIIAKALMNMRDFTQLVCEYITLIMLVDINIPVSLAHTQFIVESFEKLGVDMPTLLSALKAQQDKQAYFNYPALARRSILNWQLHCFWNISHFFNHNAWLELYPLWQDLFYTLLQKGDVESIDEAMYMQFFIYHMCGNNFHHQAQWRRFCEEIDKVASQAYEAFAKTCGVYGVGNRATHTANGKICIAFLRDRLVPNSPYKVEYSLLHNLYNDEAFKAQYEVKIYTMKLLEKSDDDKQVIAAYEGLGIEVVDVVSPFNAKGFYNSHLQKALALKDALHRDNVSILISPNNGYGISDFLLATRSAPLQIYYSHGNFVYDLSCVDARMTHICQGNRHITHEGFDFYGVHVKLQERFYNPPLDAKSQEKIHSIRAGFPKNVIVLGTIGRLMKLHSQEYWECVVEVMRSFPQTIYLACGGGNSALISECIEKVCAISGDGEEILRRVHFAGYVDSGIYGHIIDIWLDSFPLEQGESRIEYAAKGGLSLVMSKESKEERLQRLEQNLARWINIPNRDGTAKMQEQYDEAYTILAESYLSFMAFSKEEYICKACALAGLFAEKRTDEIESLRRTSAFGRAVGDEIKEYEGVNAFKEIMALNP